MRYSTLLNQNLLMQSCNSVDDVLSTFYSIFLQNNYSLVDIDNELLVSVLFYEALVTKKSFIETMEVDILNFMSKVVLYYNDLSNNIFPKYETYLIDKLGELYDEKKAKDRYTNLELLNNLADELPKDAFTNPKYRFLDMNSENGIVSFYIFNRLMKGLVDVIPNPYHRLLHILKEQLFIVNDNPLLSLFLIYLYNPKGHKDITLNLICANPLDVSLPKVDFILMNPPINNGIYEGKSKKQKVVYIKYIKKARDIADVTVTTITNKFVAARNGGNFSKDYYNIDFGLKKEIVFENKRKLNNDIKYAISLCVIDKNYKENYYTEITNGIESMIKKDRCINESFNFIDKSDIFLSIVEKLYSVSDNRIVSQIKTNLPANLRINSNSKKLSTKGKYLVLVNKKLKSEGKCFIDIDEELLPESAKKYKVAIMKNIGGRDISGNLSKSTRLKLYKLNPYELFSNTYMVYIADSKEEMKSVYSYLSCDLIQLVINNLKRSINISKQHFKNIPIIDKKTIWTNETLYKYLKLSKKEIDYLKSKIS
jgi:hypothetical protein